MLQIYLTMKTFPNFLKKCAVSLSKLSNRNILNGIGELLAPSQKNWVKVHLLEDTIFLLKTRE